MKVKRLIERLLEMDPEADVYMTQSNNDGCDTCGYGDTYSEIDIDEVTDLETKVILG